MNEEQKEEKIMLFHEDNIILYMDVVWYNDGIKKKIYQLFYLTPLCILE
jgi:hypothetical protein